MQPIKQTENKVASDYLAKTLTGYGTFGALQRGLGALAFHAPHIEFGKGTFEIITHNLLT